MGDLTIEPIKLRGSPEADFIEHLRKYLAKTGWKIVHFPNSQYSPGWPDKMIISKSFRCHKWVEFKATGGKLRDTQIQRFAELSDCGVQIFVLEGNGKETDAQLAGCLKILFGPPNWIRYVRGFHKGA